MGTSETQVSRLRILIDGRVMCEVPLQGRLELAVVMPDTDREGDTVENLLRRTCQDEQVVSIPIVPAKAESPCLERARRASAGSSPADRSAAQAAVAPSSPKPAMALIRGGRRHG